MPDVDIDGRGFYSIRGLTEEGQQWLHRNVQGYDAFVGVAYSDQSSYTQDIADGAVDAGLAVTVNGKVYHA
jgi:hypothetical protein